MRDLFLQLVLFLLGVLMGILTPLLSEKWQKYMAGILAFLLIIVAFVWAIYEWDNRDITEVTLVPTNIPTIPLPVSTPDIRETLLNWQPTVPLPVGLINEATRTAFESAYATRQLFEPIEIATRVATLPQINGYQLAFSSQWDVSALEGCQNTFVSFSSGDMLVVSYLSGVWGMAQDERNYGNGVPNIPYGNWIDNGESTYHGALIGRIDSQPSFLVGSYTFREIETSGNLFLCINDDLLNDNYGSLKVLILRYSRN